MGVVIAVVTIAIRTIMAKTASVMTPSSRPMLRITSSMRPRVFMSTPMADASRQGRPHTRAAAAEPPNLPRARDQNDEPRHEPQLAIVEQSDSRSQAAEGKEHGQQQHDGVVLEFRR